MNEKEVRALVERMIVELAGQAPTPQVKGADYHPMERETAVWTTSPRSICGGSIWSRTPATARHFWT